MGDVLKLFKTEDLTKAKETGGIYSCCRVSSKVNLSESFLISLRDVLTDDADVFIARHGRKINMQKNGTLLVKCGYKNVVQMRRSISKGHMSFIALKASS